MSKPDYKVTRTDGETGRHSTAARTTTSDAAHIKAGKLRGAERLGDSNAYKVDTIKHRK